MVVSKKTSLSNCSETSASATSLEMENDMKSPLLLSLDHLFRPSHFLHAPGIPHGSNHDDYISLDTLLIFMGFSAEQQELEKTREAVSTLESDLFEVNSDATSIRPKYKAEDIRIIKVIDYSSTQTAAQVIQALHPDKPLEISQESIGEFLVTLRNKEEANRAIVSLERANLIAHHKSDELKVEAEPFFAPVTAFVPLHPSSEFIPAPNMHMNGTATPWYPNQPARSSPPRKKEPRNGSSSNVRSHTTHKSYPRKVQAPPPDFKDGDFPTLGNLSLETPSAASIEKNKSWVKALQRKAVAKPVVKLAPVKKEPVKSEEKESESSVVEEKEDEVVDTPKEVEKEKEVVVTPPAEKAIEVKPTPAVRTFASLLRQ